MSPTSTALLPWMADVASPVLALESYLQDLQRMLNLQNPTFSGLLTMLLLLKATGLLYLYRRQTHANRRLRHTLNLLRTLTHQLSRETQTIAQLNEQLQSEQRLREQLTQMLVHDLKSPLHSILVSSHVTDAHLRQRIVEGSALQLHHLVHNILDLYKYEGQGLPLNPQRIALADVIETALVQLSLPLDIKGQTLQQRIEPPNLSIVADTDLLLRILVNLLSNAHKYGRAGRPIALRAYQPHPKTVRVEICNEGMPIPPQFQADLFQLYKTPVALAQSPYSYSTGLGLAFCRLAVEAHGGRIGFSSPAEGPVCFWFELPA